MSYYNSAFTGAKDLSKIVITETEPGPIKVPGSALPKTETEKDTLKEKIKEVVKDRFEAITRTKQIAETYTSLGIKGGCVLYISSPGRLTALTVNDDEIVMDKMQAGVLPILIKAIRFKETTASGLIGLY